MNIGVPITSLLIAPSSISISLAADTFSGNNWPQAAGPPINSPPESNRNN